MSAAVKYIEPSKGAVEAGLFNMGRKELRSLADGGNRLAKNEVARRKANRLAKKGA